MRKHFLFSKEKKDLNIVLCTTRKMYREYSLYFTRKKINVLWINSWRSLIRFSRVIGFSSNTGAYRIVGSLPNPITLGKYRIIELGMKNISKTQVVWTRMRTINIEYLAENISFMVENLRCLPVWKNFEKLNFEILIQTQKYLKH